MHVSATNWLRNDRNATNSTSLKPLDPGLAWGLKLLRSSLEV